MATFLPLFSGIAAREYEYILSPNGLKLTASCSTRSRNFCSSV